MTAVQSLGIHWAVAIACQQLARDVARNVHDGLVTGTAFGKHSHRTYWRRACYRLFKRLACLLRLRFAGGRGGADAGLADEDRRATRRCGSSLYGPRFCPWILQNQ